MANQLSVKVYYIENQKTKEIRKFSVDAEVAGNFEYLAGKIREIFPDLRRKDIEVFWKDDEQDYLTISSDNELDQALHAVPIDQTVLKLFVKLKGQAEKNPNQETTEHPGITCDGCDGNIKGIRYKCSQCFDFDLCQLCEVKGVHPEDHEMIAIKKPRQHYSEFFMNHPGHMRGACGRRGPFGNSRDGHFGHPRSGPFGHHRGGPFGRFGGGQFHRGRCHARGSQRPWESEPFFCSFNIPDPTANSSNPEQAEKQGECPKPNEEQFQECIRDLASAFGLEPDVAITSMKSFFDSSPKKDASNTQDRSEKEQEENRYFDNFVNHFSKSFGLDPNFVAQATFFPQGPQNEEEKTNGNEAAAVNIGVDVKIKPSTKKEDEKNVEDESMETSPIEPQREENKETQQDCPSKQQQVNQVEDEPIKPVEFIFVEEKDHELSEEEKYQHRLNKALKQMETMGFDNDGGWLSQLLVSKDLSIGRVLDALNPAN